MVEVGGGQMSHSVCGECSELDYRAVGELNISVGGDMTRHAQRLQPVPRLSATTEDEVVPHEPSILALHFAISHAWMWMRCATKKGN